MNPFERLSDDLRIEIAQYLGVAQLAQLCIWCTEMNCFSGRHLRAMLVNRLQSTRLDVRTFDIGQLFYLYQVVLSRFRVDNFHCLTEQGQLYLNQSSIDSDIPPNLVGGTDSDPVTLTDSYGCGVSLYLTQHGDLYHDPRGLRPFELAAAGVGTLRQIYSDSEVTYLIAGNGQVYRGNNRQETPWSFAVIDGHQLPKIVKLDRTADNWFLLTEDGQVYRRSIGSQEDYQLIDEVAEVIEMYIDQYSVFFLTKMGQVYAMGINHGGVHRVRSLSRSINCHTGDLIITCRHR